MIHVSKAICYNLHILFFSVLSYYGHQPPYPRVVYRHVTPYQSQVPYMPSPMIPVVPVVQTVHYAAPPPPPIHMGAARHVTYFAPPPMPPPHMHHHHPHPHHHHHPYVPAASQPQSYYSPYGAPPPAPSPQTSPKRPFKHMFTNGGPFAAYSHHVPKASIFTKIKPYIFGGQGQRSLPHHPYYPNVYHPHQFTPNRPYQNSPSAHHAYPVHAPPPAHSPFVMNPQKSCSCSLHVGQLTVYKHTDMRSSYSCTDLKDCNSFCTNLVSTFPLFFFKFCLTWDDFKLRIRVLSPAMNIELYAGYVRNSPLLWSFRDTSAGSVRFILQEEEKKKYLTEFLKDEFKCRIQN